MNILFCFGLNVYAEFSHRPFPEICPEVPGVNGGRILSEKCNYHTMFWDIQISYAVKQHTEPVQ